MWVFTDSDYDVNATLANYGALFKAQDIKASVNFVLTNYNLCGAPNGGANGPSDIMIQTAQSTFGFLYYTTHAGNMLQAIPTYHRSSVLMGDEQDCSGNGASYYLQMDSWTQSFVVSAQGQNVQIALVPPVGAQPVSYYENSIDQDTYLHIVQYLIPCAGDSWVARGAYCYIYPNPINMVTW